MFQVVVQSTFGTSFTIGRGTSDSLYMPSVALILLIAYPPNDPQWGHWTLPLEPLIQKSYIVCWIFILPNLLVLSFFVENFWFLEKVCFMTCFFRCSEKQLSLVSWQTKEKSHIVNGFCTSFVLNFSKLFVLLFLKIICVAYLLKEHVHVSFTWI